MNSKLTFTWEQAKQVAVQVVFKHSGEYLKDIEIRVIQGAWEGLTYEKIAEIHNLSVNYIRGDIGPKLWQKLSYALGEEVTKMNFKEALQRKASQMQQSSLLTILPFPEGAVALDSPLYIEREGVESLCYETIVKPGSLIRIKAPKLMGKTSLMIRVIAEAQSQKYRKCT